VRPQRTDAKDQTKINGTIVKNGLNMKRIAVFKSTKEQLWELMTCEDLVLFQMRWF
jgi:hypothetical protein